MAAPTTTRLLALSSLLAVACAPRAGAPPLAGLSPEMRERNEPAEPFRVIGNVHYVGTRDLAIFLITTPAGHILLDSGFEQSVPHVVESVRRLGFEPEDIEILISSHAHRDHVGGHARIRELTGARVFAMARDAEVIAAGGGGPIAFDERWRSCAVDRVLRDGDVVELGGTALTAHLTAGHTKGATTWTMRVDEDGRALDVLFFSSATLFDSTPIAGNVDYPEVAADLERSYAFWNGAACDVFLAAHGSFFQVRAKRERLARGETPNPFIDPAGWKRFIAGQEQKFRGRLAKP